MQRPNGFNGLKLVLCLFPGLLLLAACGGGSDGGSNFSPVENMRNDCNMGIMRQLATNGYPLDQFSGSAISYYKRKGDGTYGWYPLALFSATSDYDFSFSKTTSGNGKDDRCDLLSDLFLSSQTGNNAVRSRITFEYTFPGFAFPASQEGISSGAAIIPAEVSGALVWDFFQGNAAYSTPIKTVRVPVQMHCDNTFSVKRSWEPATVAGQDGGEDAFCRTDGPSKTCLQFAADFGDNCQFKATNGRFETAQGRKFTATLGGKLTKQDRGYQLSVTAYELD